MVAGMVRRLRGIEKSGVNTLTIRGTENNTPTRASQGDEAAHLLHYRQTASGLTTTSSKTAIRAATPWVT
jgi:hypothetical protein